MAPPPSQDELKKQVGYKAVDDYVRSGMVVGLGTGSTAYFAVERVGQKLRSGELKDIVAIPTSKRTKEQAEGLGIPLATMDNHPVVDVAIVDESKLFPGLGPGFPLPVEIVPFCHEHTARQIEALPALAGARAVLRRGSAANNKRDGDDPAVTDNGNYIVDLHFIEPIKDPLAAAAQLKATIGVVEHGLFCGMASSVVVAGKDGV